MKLAAMTLEGGGQFAQSSEHAQRHDEGGGNAVRPIVQECLGFRNSPIYHYSS